MKRTPQLRSILRYRRYSALFVLLVCLTIGHVRSFAGIVHEPTIWDKQEIRVCWGTVSDASSTCETSYPLKIDNANIEVPSLEGRRLIRTWIDAEYAASRTGIHFTGWQTCAANPDADVVIFFSEAKTHSDSGGGATLGNCGPGLRTKSGKAWLRLDLVTQQPSRISKFIAIHEFGHLAGLAHEDFNHPSDVTLRSMLANPAYQLATPYDAFSIMSYKWMAQVELGKSTEMMEAVHLVSANSLWGRGDRFVAQPLVGQRPDFIQLRSKPALSAGDIHTLRCLYVMNDAERSKHCF